MKRFFGRAAGAGESVKTIVGPLESVLGRPATADEVEQFELGVGCRNIRLPETLRGLAAVPAAAALLRQAAAYDWHRRRAGAGLDELPAPPDLAGNLATAWNGPALAFLHFEKSGGVALMKWLSSYFHPVQIDADTHRDASPHLFYRAAPGLAVPREKMIWGHYDLPALRRMGSGRLVFTLLREPRARLVSLYHYWRAIDPAKIDPNIFFNVASAHRLTLAMFLEPEEPMMLDLLDNVYVRRLTGFYATGAGRDVLAEEPESALRQAMAALDTVDIVGVTEHFDASVAMLAARLGVPPPEQNAGGNVTAENFRDPSGWFREITPAVPDEVAQAALGRRTSLDARLYEYALARFREAAGL
jgi:hypothetical protein